MYKNMMSAFDVDNIIFHSDYRNGKFYFYFYENISCKAKSCQTLQASFLLKSFVCTCIFMYYISTTALSPNSSCLRLIIYALLFIFAGCWHCGTTEWIWWTASAAQTIQGKSFVCLSVNTWVQSIAHGILLLDQRKFLRTQINIDSSTSGISWSIYFFNWKHNNGWCPHIKFCRVVCFYNFWIF